MKRKLIAAAVAGAFIAPAAYAQTSTVQMYGLLNVEYGFASPANTGAAPGTDRSGYDALNSGASRIGFKGEEKLGSGMSAWFQCESDIRFIGGGSTSAGALCDRNSALGLKGGFGNVYAGSWDSPMKRVSAITRMTNETGWLGSQQMTLSNGGAWTGSFSTRGTNTINYDTPSFGGFSASAQYSTLQAAKNDGVAPTKKGRQMSFSGQYVAGPMALVGAYSVHDDDRTTAGAVAGLGQEDKAYFLGGTYSFGAAKIGLSYINAEINSTTVKTERDSWHVAFDYKITAPGTIRFGYSQAGDAEATTKATGVMAGQNTGAKLWQVGYNHAMSKRTTASLSYARMDNKSAGTYSLTGVTSGAIVTPGSDAGAIVLGMNHTF
jgi:predicted porin